MSQLTGTRIFNAIKGLFSSLDETDAILLKRMLGVRFKTRVAMSDGGATATSVPLITFFNNDSGVSLKVVSAQLMTPVTVAPGATNNVAFVLDKVDSAGANNANIATYTSDVAGGTATADVPKALTVVGGTSTVAVLASGWSLRASATKGASGVPISDATGAAILEVTMEYDT
jgi:hypothetical protein